MKFLSTFDATVTEEWKNAEGLSQVAWRMFLTRPNSNLLPFPFFFPSGASYYNRSVLLTERLLHGNVLRIKRFKKTDLSSESWKRATVITVELYWACETQFMLSLAWDQCHETMTTSWCSFWKINFWLGRSAVRWFDEVVFFEHMLK